MPRSVAESTATAVANMLYRAGVTTAEQVAVMHDHELLALRNFGTRMLARVRAGDPVVLQAISDRAARREKNRQPRIRPLTESERTVLAYRFTESPMPTYRQIGERIERSHERVRQILMSGIRKVWHLHRMRDHLSGVDAQDEARYWPLVEQFGG